MTARDILARNLAWTREHAGTTWLDFIRTHDDTKSTNDARDTQTHTHKESVPHEKAKALD